MVLTDWINGQDLEFISPGRAVRNFYGIISRQVEARTDTAARDALFGNVEAGFSSVAGGDFRRGLGHLSDNYLF